MNKLWACPKCRRKFEKRNQSHSCSIYPIEKHFNGKETAKLLYTGLVCHIKKSIGLFKVESLPCCIHFVTSFTFAAVYALRDRIRIHFTLDHKIENSRIDRFSQISANRFLYSLNVKNKREINKELINWLRQAYHLRKRR